MSIKFYKEAHYALNLTEDNVVLKEYLKKNGYDIDPTKTSWCAAYVGAVLNACGYEGTHSLLARSYLKWGIYVPMDDIQLGDIVVLKIGILPWQGHVGFKCASPWDTTKINLLGGNQSDKVCIKTFNTSDILGIRREGK